MKAAARYCSLCGKPLNTARGKCDTCEPAPRDLVPHGKDYSTLIGVGILVLMIVFSFGSAMDAHIPSFGFILKQQNPRQDD